MQLKPGDKISVERWDINNGICIGKYEVVSVNKKTVTLREMAIVTPKGASLAGSRRTLALDALRANSHFAIPIEDRCRRMMEDIELMIAQLKQPK